MPVTSRFGPPSAQVGSTSRRLSEPADRGLVEQLVAVAHPELAHQVRAVELHGVDRDEHGLRHLGIGRSTTQMVEHLALPPRDLEGGAVQRPGDGVRLIEAEPLDRKSVV